MSLVEYRIQGGLNSINQLITFLYFHASATPSVRTYIVSAVLASRIHWRASKLMWYKLMQANETIFIIFTFQFCGSNAYYGKF